MSKGTVADWSWDLFWWCQMDQAVTANRGNNRWFFYIERTRFENEPSLSCVLTSQPNLLCHTWLTLEQPHNACLTSSRWSEQRWHTFSWMIVLFLRFSFVGNELVHDFHKKCLIFLGTLSFHTLFQNFLWASVMSVSRPSAYWSSQRILYPDFTE